MFHLKETELGCFAGRETSRLLVIYSLRSYDNTAESIRGVEWTIATMTMLLLFEVVRISVGVLCRVV